MILQIVAINALRIFNINVIREVHRLLFLLGRSIKADHLSFDLRNENKIQEKGKVMYCNIQPLVFHCLVVVHMLYNAIILNTDR
jgi:hypothetical protein